METRCIPLDFYYRQDPPQTGWWVMRSEGYTFGIEDQLPILADTVLNGEVPSASPIIATPGDFTHRREAGQIVITIYVPCDERGNVIVESELRQSFEDRADEIFWELYPEAELV